MERGVALPVISVWGTVDTTALHGFCWQVWLTAVLPNGELHDFPVRSFASRERAEAWAAAVFPGYIVEWDGAAS